MLTRILNVHVGRPTALLLIVVLVGLAVYQPANQIVTSTGDVRLYQIYAQRVLDNPRVLPREYPPLSAAIFVVPQLLAPQLYGLVFAMMAAVAAWLTVLVVEHLNGRGWWLALFLLLGTWATLFFRYDIFVVLLTVLAFAAASRSRWTMAQALLGVGVALKLYPVLWMPLVVVWQWRSERRWPLSSVISGAIALGMALGSMWLLAPEQVAGMLSYHGQRPLQIESVGASLIWLLGPTSGEWSFGSVNLQAPIAPVVIQLLSVATVLALPTVYLAFAWRRISPAVAWALVIAVSLATSKVFSTQYLQWALPFVVLAVEGTSDEEQAATPLMWSRIVWILICVTTSLVYPIAFKYWEPVLVGPQPPALFMLAVTVRNALWLVACALLLRQVTAGVKQHVFSRQPSA